MIYVQYDPTTGNIVASVSTQGDAPVPPLQISVPDGTDLTNMMVNVMNNTLVPINN